jgi:glycosyltransferase involved in cell wall biosynthesis
VTARPDPLSRPLRIGLNLVFMGERAGGVGRYASELPGALLAAEPETEVHVFVSREAPAELRAQAWADAVRWTMLPVRLHGPPLHVPAQFAALPLLAAARRLDVLHSPANAGPAITPGTASVITLHDLIWLHRPSEWETSPRAHRAMRRVVSHSLRHADRVFADSRAAAEDFASTLGVPRERIDVTPLGVRAPAEGSRAGEASVRAQLELGSARVLLCVAQKRPYKNLHRLIRALPDLEDDVTLVLPGSPTDYERELRALAAELGVAGRVRFPDWLSEDQLDGLYALSSAFILPSLIEGFGLPVLEAMVRGVPVACSNVSALPEVAGEAALLFDPASQAQVTGAAQRLLGDRVLAERLALAGRERAARFTWRRAGEASLAGYRRAIGARG